MSYWRSAFSEADGTGSTSRLLATVHTLVACACFAHVAWHTHAIPDATTMGGLGAFAGVPYALNAAKSTISSFAKGEPPK